MHLEDFDYDLPAERIAQRPLDRRDASRMLVLSRVDGAITDSAFADIESFLSGDELLVLNNTRVVPARLFGHRVGVHSQPPSRARQGEHLSGEV
jgi:S-adenosylmethionine:tRNA ribosyltransferase-isomerase